MNRLLLVVVLFGCACPDKQTTKPIGGNGTPADCAAVRPKVEQLYRAEAQVKEPTRVDQAVADNTTMVMNDCNKAVDKSVACINSVSTVAELEVKCLRPLDEEGTEGNELR